MRKKIVAIRDMNVIENELKNAIAGFLIVHSDDEIIARYVSTFIYSDKNVFIPFDEDDDVLNKTEEDKNATFTVIRSEGNGKCTKENNAFYKYLSITLEGIIKKADDIKQLPEIHNAYSAKYFKANSADGIKQFYMIDTEEFQAIEETGI